MFQIMENQITNSRHFLEYSESGAGPDLNKPCWTWIDFVNSHQVLPPLYLDTLGSLYRVYLDSLQLISLVSTVWEDVSSSPRPASFGNEIGCIGMAVCLWPASPGGLRLPLHAGNSGVLMDTISISPIIVFRNRWLVLLVFKN